MTGRRHPQEEIVAMLRQADDMAKEGKTQREITRALGVSVMTYHRWRKLKGEGARHASNRPAAGAAAIPRSHAIAIKTAKPPNRRFDELQIENGRLRRLVTDLLLEKMKLEDEVRVVTGARFPRMR